MLKIWVLLLAACGAALAVHEAVVKFNAKGIRGTITFTELPEDNGIEPIQIDVDLSGLQGQHNWHVHWLPVDQTVDPSSQCLGDWVGPHYDPFGANTDAGYSAQCASNATLCEAGDLAGKFGQINSNQPISVVDRTGTLFLDGRYSIIGRSIVIHNHLDGTNFECGTIRSREEVDGAGVTVLQSTFVSPLAGTIYIKQVAGDTAYMWGKLFWTDDSPTTTEHNWHIHENIPSPGERLGTCSDVGPHYDPTDNRGGSEDTTYFDRCTPETPSSCEVGDLTGKHAQITVDAQPWPFSRNAFFFTDTYLNLTGTNSVADRSIAVHIQGSGPPIIACAPLVASEDLTVSQYPDNYFKASQLSPFENTVITTTGDLPSTQVSILSAAFSPQTNCLTDDSAPLYDDTYTGFPQYTGDGEQTPDTYFLGDLQNRYSDDLTTTGGTFEVSDMPIYGTEVTISNRALRVVDSRRRECSALLPKDLFTDVLGGEVIMAKASFSSGELAGGIYFIQRDYGGGVLGNTYIIVDLYYRNETMPTTTGHNWHVHQNPPLSQGQNCASEIGPHFNPFGVSLANTDDTMTTPSVNSNYSDDCSPQYSLRCESGDLSNKHGKLQISAAIQNRKTYTYVDNNLALTSNYSIVGRSIGIHRPTSEGGDLFDCAEVERTYPADDSLVTSTLGETRAEVVEGLVSGSTVPSSCVLTLSQVAGGDGLTETTFRVFGESETAANSNRDQLAGGAIRTTAPMLLMTAAYLIVTVAIYGVF